MSTRKVFQMKTFRDRNASFPSVISDQSRAKQIDLNPEKWEKIWSPCHTTEQADEWRRQRQDALEGRSRIVLKAWTMDETGWAYRDGDGNLIADPNFRHFASSDGNVLFGKSEKTFLDIYEQKSI